MGRAKEAAAETSGKLVPSCDESSQVLLQGKWRGSDPMGRVAESSQGHQEPLSRAGRFGGEGLLETQSRS